MAVPIRIPWFHATVRPSACTHPQGTETYRDRDKAAGGNASVRAASLSLSRGLHLGCRRFWGPSRYINICPRPPQITSHQIRFSSSISLFIINRRLATIKSPESSILLTIPPTLPDNVAGPTHYNNYLRLPAYINYLHPLPWHTDSSTATAVCPPRRA